MGQRRPCRTHTCPVPSPFPLQKNQVTCQDHLVTIIDPSRGPVHTRLKGMPYFFKMMGEMSVILCLRKASQPCELPGKKPGVESSIRVVSVWGTGLVASSWGAGTDLEPQAGLRSATHPSLSEVDYNMLLPASVGDKSSCYSHNWQLPNTHCCCKLLGQVHSVHQDSY